MMGVMMPDPLNEGNIRGGQLDTDRRKDRPER
jgi:hypothetical protein